MSYIGRERQPTVLHVGHGPHAVVEFAEAGKLLRERGWRVVVLDSQSFGAEIEAVARDRGFEWLSKVPAAATTNRSQVAAQSTWRSFIRRIPILNSLAICAYTIAHGLRHARRLQAEARELLDSIKPDVLVVLDDRSGGIPQALLSEAKRRGLRTIVGPNEAMTEGRELHYAGRKTQGATLDKLGWAEHALNYVLAAIGIQNVGRSEGQGVFWRGPATMLAEWMVIGAARNPWVRGGNADTDVVAVSSATYRDTLLHSGIEGARLSLIGYPRHDEIAIAQREAPRLRRELSGQLSVPETVPLILVGLADFRQLVHKDVPSLLADLRFIVTTVRAHFPDHAIVFARHPRIDAQTLRQRAAELFEIDRTYLPEGFTTYELIVLSDLYVPCYSGTTYGAIAAGKIAVFYDFTGSEAIERFIGWSSEVPFTRTRAQFTEQMRILADPEGRRRQQERVTAGSRKYGLVDGRNSERFAALVEDSLATRSAAV